jgi:hypothetical protein
MSLVVLLLPSLACNTLLPPRPAVEWNHSATAVIAELQIGGGMLYEPNPMPVSRLWGDGRLVWVNGDASGQRRVRVANLTPDQVQKLLQAFVDAGFFGWKDSYSPGVVYDAPSTCLRVSLTTFSKSVCEMLSGAPARFHDLGALLAVEGAGLTGADYVPTRGYLRVKLVDLAQVQGNPPVTTWPAATAGVSLEQIAASGGQWIEGNPLALARHAVNANPLNPVLQDGDRYYQAQVLIAGVTAMEPP